MNFQEHKQLTAKAASDIDQENPMREIRIEKVTVNIAVGKSGEPLEKAKKILQQITKHTPCQRNAKRTVKDWGIRKRRTDRMYCHASWRRIRVLPETGLGSRGKQDPRIKF